MAKFKARPTDRNPILSDRKEQNPGPRIKEKWMEYAIHLHFYFTHLSKFLIHHFILRIFIITLPSQIHSILPPFLFFSFLSVNFFCTANTSISFRLTVFLILLHYILFPSRLLISGFRYRFGVFDVSSGIESVLVFFFFFLSPTSSPFFVSS